MSSYLVTGVSRGIGLGFLAKLSANPDNTVFGLVRDKASTDKTVAAELPDRKNIHILEADLVDYEAMKESVEYVSKVTGGSLDYIIANGAFVPSWSAWDDVSILGQSPKQLEEEIRKAVDVNVIGNLHLFNLYMPLILKGRGKKVITISSGMADTDFIRKYEIYPATPYAISKAGVNIVIAKFSALYASQGVLFLGICPGSVTTDSNNSENATPEQLEKMGKLGAKFSAYAPDWKGPATVEDAVEAVLSVMEKSSVENGNGGDMLSHFGNKQWM